MLFKVQKSRENINPRVSKASNSKQCYENVLYMAVKNKDFLRNKKQVEY